MAEDEESSSSNTEERAGGSEEASQSRPMDRLRDLRPEKDPMGARNSAIREESGGN